MSAPSSTAKQEKSKMVLVEFFEDMMMNVE